MKKILKWKILRRYCCNETNKFLSSGSINLSGFICPSTESFCPHHSRAKMWTISSSKGHKLWNRTIDNSIFINKFWFFLQNLIRHKKYFSIWSLYKCTLKEDVLQIFVCKKMAICENVPGSTGVRHWLFCNSHDWKYLLLQNGCFSSLDWYGRIPWF